MEIIQKEITYCYRVIVLMDDGYNLTLKFPMEIPDEDVFKEAERVYTLITEKPTILWHDESCKIQIKQSNADALNMISTYPDIIMYKKANNINTTIEIDFTYTYVNFLYEEHRSIFTRYGAEITER